MKTHSDSLLFYHFQSIWDMEILEIRFIFVNFSWYRLEKDQKYNYFWVRCTKLITVSVHYSK